MKQTIKPFPFWLRWYDEEENWMLTKLERERQRENPLAALLNQNID